MKTAESTLIFSVTAPQTTSPNYTFCERADDRLKKYGCEEQGHTHFR